MNKEKNHNVGMAKVQEPGSIPDSALPVKKGARDDKGNKLKPLPPHKYDAAGEIKKFGLQPTEMLEYKDPFSGTIKKIMIDRRGTTDEALALALLDHTMPRERKESMLSMYLFEMGKQGSSTLMDLWMYKGAHTKESRAFQSQMRFDFEMFLGVFQMFMQDSHDMVWKNLPLEVTEIEVEEEGSGGKKKMVKKEFVKVTRDVTANEIAVVLGEFGRYHKMTSELLGQRMKAETQKRERARGKGIYVGIDNRPYSVYEDGDIVEVVTKDKEAADAEKQNGTTD